MGHGDFDEVTEVFTEEGQDDKEIINSWTQNYHSTWDHRMVLDFLYHVVNESKLDLNHFSGEAYSNLDGESLMQMNLQEHLKRSPKMGNFIYRFCQELRQKSNFEPPAACFFKSPSSVIPTTVESLSIQTEYDVLNPSLDIPIYSELTSFNNNQPFHESLDFFNQQHQQLFNAITPPNHQSQWQVMGGYHEQLPTSQQLTEHTQLNHLPFNSQINIIENDFNFNKTCIQWPSYNTNNNKNVDSKANNISGEDRAIIKQKRGRPRKRKNSFDDEELFGPRKTITLPKSKLLWEFICDLLKSSGDNISLEIEDSMFLEDSHTPRRKKARVVEWEDREEGVFRIIDSIRVAELWGKHKSSKKMSFEKFTRALRWCKNESKTMGELPKDKVYPKRCFRFGPRAQNWRELTL